MATITAQGPTARATAQGPIARTTALRLGPIVLANISKFGGYDFRRAGRVPSGHHVWLVIGDQPDVLKLTSAECLDITGGYGPSQLPALLTLLNKHGWARERPKQIRCQAFFAKAGKIVAGTGSNVCYFPVPVQPYEGILDPVELGASKPKLTYPIRVGVLRPAGGGVLKDRGEDIPAGRILTAKINGKYFFKYGGLFETNPAMRGFDCCTYVGSAYGLQSNMQNGADLAAALFATDCHLNKVTGTKIREYFAATSGLKGKYLLWKGSHVALVIDGNVHEFCHSGNGYCTCRLQEWRTLSQTVAEWTLKRLGGVRVDTRTTPPKTATV